jgi:hypothetical protein
MKKKNTLLKAICFLCFLVAGINVNAQVPDWLWARVAGGNSYNEATSIATDDNGNTYVAGYYNIYAYDLPHANGTDVFFVKYDPYGNIIWTRALSSTGTDRVFSIALDKLGHFYILGYFGGPSIVFCGDTLTNTVVNKFDMFVAKYDTDGNCIWVRQAGGAGQDTPAGMAVDSLGNCFITGYFESPTLSFGTQNVVNTGGVDLFVAKYDPDGTDLWAKSATGDANEYSRSVAVDKFGNSYITGDFNTDSIWFDGNLLVETGNQDLFLTKYSSVGNVLWIKHPEGTQDMHGNSVAVDSAANIYVGGYFNSSMTIDTTTLTSNGNLDILLFKYATDGSFLWAKSVGGTAEDAATTVATDYLGYCYLAGYFNSASITMGAYPLTNNGSGFKDIFVSEYSAAGNVVWAKSIGGLTSDYPNDIQPDLSRDVYVAGCLGSTSITIGDSTFYNAGTTNILVAKSGNTTPSGMIEFGDPVSISVYPNPAKETITVNLPENSTVELINMQGQICKKINTTLSEIRIDVSNMPSGVYLIKVVNDHNIALSKLIKN